ncbi:ATP-binding protein [Piscinibacter defluvii]|uniref:ATP-binding protein n=1 Tax=Piscinibacter defluvii TaxID=1796922 RepID=UPI000FDDA14C|nr:winged helix-turn-helix domain-containing protein [Piscinibacter defluvii]
MSSAYRFGRFELRPDRRLLLVEGEAVALGTRAFDLLVALVERRERVATKGELLEAVWPGLVVEENNLQVQVNALRKLLGPQSIATLAGRGYRFVEPIELVADAGQPLRVARVAHNLPHERTRFIGREVELAECAQWLAESRLVTLTGIGGCGKSRLAAEVARRGATQFVDGVRRIDLAPVSSPERVVGEVARAWQVVEERQCPLDEALPRQLGSRHVLLVLDNCEHLLDACAELVDCLLDMCDHVHVLATSREPLGVEGEHVLAVRPLDLPPEGAGVDAATGSAAVRLFVDRARHVVPAFDLADHNVAVVIDVCRRLDGIALALELAAARLATLSLEDLQRMLSDRFRLLTAGGRGLARHQALHATLQWSYDTLNADEQRLLRWLSVFAGGWTLASAAAVCRADEPEIEVADRLRRIVDKSLVELVRQPDGGARYGMLETVRQFALDQLLAHGEARPARDAHLDHFIGVAQALCERMSESTEIAYERIEVELQNFMAAHQWCDENHISAELGLVLVTRLRRYLGERCPFSVGERLFQQALARPGAQSETLARADALFSLGQHLCWSGRRADAAGILRDAQRIAEIHQAPDIQSLSLTLLLHAQLIAGDSVAAEETARRAFEIAQSSETGLVRACAWAGRGTVHQFAGRYDEASSAMDEAMALIPDGDPSNLAYVLRLRARASIGAGRLADARAQTARSLTLARHLMSLPELQPTIETAARLAAALGDFERSAWTQGVSDALAGRIGIEANAFDDPALARLRARPVEVLGPEQCAAKRAAGMGAAPDSAIDEVLAWLQRASAET